MGVEGVGVALKIEDDILKGLETAEEKLRNMSAYTDKIAEQFKAAGTTVQGVLDSIQKNASLEMKVDLKDMTASLSVLKDVESTIGSVKSAADRGFQSEEQLVKGISRIMENNADGYTKVRTRIQQVTDWMERYDRAAANANIQGNPFNDSTVQLRADAEKYLKALQERFNQMGGAFDFSKAKKAMEDALNLDDLTFDRATERLDKLHDAIMEVTRPGSEGAAHASEVNQWLAALNKAMEETEKKIPALKKRKEDVEQYNQLLSTKAAVNLLPETTPEEARAKISEIMSLIKKFEAEEKDGNLLFNQQDVDDAKRKVRDLENYINANKESDTYKGAMDKLSYILGLDENSMSDKKRKISALETQLKNLTLLQQSGKVATKDADITAQISSTQARIDALKKAVADESGRDALSEADAELTAKLATIESAKADSSTKVKQEIRELTEWLAKYTEAKDEATKNGIPVSQSLMDGATEAQRYLSDLQDRLQLFGGEFDMQEASNAFGNAFRANFATYDEAIEKLRLLDEAMILVTKEGGDSAANSSTINSWIKILNQEIEKTKAALPQLKLDKEFTDDYTAAHDAMVKALSLPDTTVEDAKEKINEIRSALKKLDKEQEKHNPLFSQQDIDDGEQAVKSLQKYINNLKESGTFDDARIKLDYALGLDDASIEEKKRKISALEAQIKNLTILRESGNASAFTTEINDGISRAQTLADALKAAIDAEVANEEENELLRLMGLTDAGIDEARQKLSHLQSAYNKALKDMANNIPVDPNVVAQAEAELKRLRGHILDLERDLAVNADKEDFELINTVNSARGLDNLQRKINELQSILEKVKKESDGDTNILKWVTKKQKEVDELNERLKAMNTLMRVGNHVAGQFGQMMGSLISGFALTKIVKDVVDIRGEFEMAEKSLGIILKDAAAASDIFQQIQSIAVKSPFQVKDLVKDTKQLAAYRIETDKLVSTTKMLGDISAGVGVDMNRLILAYGQVKAATVLKGTELRQFSEAGVNMLDGLADRMSKLNGRIVTTGEVMAMVSKKMIKFSDVEAVLRSETEIGGTFYRMQEQQAETIQGLISNLRDRFDITLNEVGKDYDSIIRKVIDGITYIIENWRKMEGVIGAGVAFVAVTGAVNGLARSITFLGSATEVLKNLGGVFKSIDIFSLASLGPVLGGILAVVIGVAVAFRRAREETRQFNRLIKETNKDIAKQSAEYTRLANTISDGTKTIKEREAALEEMKNTYGNIIDLTNENINSINAEGEAYSRNIELIRSYNLEKALETQRARNSENVGDRIDTEAKRIAKTMKSSLGRNNAFKEYVKDLKGSETTIAGILMGMQQDFESGEKSIGELTDDFIGEFNKHFNADAIAVGGESLRGSIAFWISQIVDEAEEGRERLEEIAERYHHLDFSPAMKKYEPAVKELEKLKMQLEQLPMYLNAETGEPDEKLVKRFMIAGFGDEAQVRAYLKEQAAIVAAATNEYDLSDVTQALMDNYVSTLRETIKNDNSVKSVHGDLERKINSQLKSVQLDKSYTLSNDIMQNVWDAFKDSIDNDELKNILVPLQRQTDQSFIDWRKIIAEHIDEIKQTIEAWEHWQSHNGSYKGTFYSEDDMLTIHGSSLEKAKEMLGVYEFMNETLTLLLGKIADASAKSKRESDLKAFIQELKKASSEFDKLDDKGDEYLQRRLEILGGKIGVNITKSVRDMSTEEINKWIDSLINQIPDEEQRMELKLAFNKDDTADALNILKEQVSELWDKYDTAKKMRDLGMSFVGYDTDSIYQEILALEKKLNGMNTEDSIKAANDVRKKRLNILRNEQEESAKLIHDNTQKALSETEQAYSKMYEEIEKIRTKSNNRNLDEKISDEDVMAGVKGTMDKYFKDIAKAEWEAFKGSQAYIMAFGDLDALGNEVLESLKSQLETWVETADLAPTEMKQIQDAIKKINDQIASNNVMKNGGAIKSWFNAVKQAQQDFSKLPGLEKNVIDSAKVKNEAKETVEIAKENLRKAKEEQTRAELAYNAAMAEDDRDASDESFSKREVATNNLTEATVNALQAQHDLEVAERQLNDATNDSNAAEKELTDTRNRALATLKNSTKNIEALQSAYSALGDILGDSIDYVKSFADAFGLAFSEDTTDVLDAFMNGFGLVEQGIALTAGAIEGTSAAIEYLNTALGVTETLLWPLLAVAAVIGVTTAAIKAHDNAIVRDIEHHKETVENLTKSYDKLNEAIDRAMDISQFHLYTSQMKSNLNEQKRQIEEMIALEESRGSKKDKDALKSYNDDLLEIEEKFKEMDEKMLEYLGAPTNYQDEARNWASAWLSAFKKGESGVDALKDSFENLYDDMVAGQIQALVFGSSMEKLKEMIEMALLDDGIIDETEANAIRSYKENALQDLSESAEMVAKTLGVVKGAANDNTLSRGVQSITESTASALEAIVSNINFNIAQSNEARNQILAILRADGGNSMINPMLNELKAQTALIQALNDNMMSMMRAGHAKGGYGLKVFLE